MIDRLTSICLGAGKLFLAQAEGLLVLAQRSAIWGAAAFAGGCAILLAIIGLLVAVTATMALYWGWVVALTISSLFLGVMGLVTILVARHALTLSASRRDLPPDISAKILEAQEQIKGPEEGDKGATSTEGFPFDISKLKGWEAEAAAFVSKNPAAVVSGALCALAIVGPGRVLRLASQGMMLAGLVSGLRKEMSPKPPETGT
ncbi:MAG: hypothetical protein WC718_11955 [Phycisphaerales bacterium]|jgi:uncharacterized oligopeptide transporter (OPT) family protein